MRPSQESAFAIAVRISPVLLNKCVRAVNATFPLESGGVLMGRLVDDSTLLIDDVIGPGPRARHERYRFEPDIEWQHAEIAKHYDASHGTSTYLGDWHSHPNAAHGDLSYVDRKALRTIIEAPEARCQKPLMAILWGAPEHWDLAIWQGLLRPRRLFGQRLIVNAIRIAEPN